MIKNGGKKVRHIQMGFETDTPAKKMHRKTIIQRRMKQMPSPI
jgi:hypothetical protein